MTTARVVETSVTVNNNSPIQDYVHLDDQTQPTFEMTPGFKPFTMLQFVYPTLYVKPVKQITFLYHSITLTSGMTDCSDDQLEKFKLENVYCGEIFLQEKCVLEKS